jgi:glycosyltransferase involved in cell wall biosynthesis
VVGDSKFGGGDVVICEWLGMLKGHGIDATLLATDPSTVEFAGRYGIEVWPFAGIGRAVNPLRDLGTTLRLAEAIRGRFDIVHTNTTKGGAIGRTAARLACVPVVLHTVHGFAFHEFSSRPATTLIASLERLLAMMSDRVIFVNEYDRLRAVEMGILPQRKAVTVYNGLGPERIAPGLETDRDELLGELHLGPQAVLCVFVGRLAEQKGLRHLLEALSICRRRRGDIDLHQAIIGEGEQEGLCRLWAGELGLADRVHFLGFRSDAVRWTGGGDVFTLASLWEGHSISLLEAMGCGTAIVATDIKGNRESITDGADGVLVAPADAEALADGILRLAGDRQYARRVGQAARETFLKRFTLEKMLENTWRVYEDVLSEKHLL